MNAHFQETWALNVFKGILADPITSLKQFGLRLPFRKWIKHREALYNLPRNRQALKRFVIILSAIKFLMDG
jgi:hypothetical protein